MYDIKTILRAFAALMGTLLLIMAAGFAPAVVFAGSSSNTVSASVTVPGTCIPGVSNTAISFPSTQDGGFAPTSNAVQVTDEGAGNSGSNILLSGTNWIYSSNTFIVTNTLWNQQSGGNTGNQLQLTATDTKIALAIGGSNILYFGVNVPPSQSAGTYSQTITVSTSC